jgi:uncharacterized sporulation protein YeaH/YhbH (DUF444 family)
MTGRSTFIFIDRRKTGRGKSLNNRQKLLERIKESIRSAKPDDIDAGGVSATGGVAKKTLSNPIKIAKSALHEPTYHYEPYTGEIEVVLIGNDRWERGDKFPVNGEGSGGGSGEGAGEGEDGEDDFIINISRSEFFDVFFEDCELPDLQESQEKDNPEAVWKPAGFQKEGSAAQLSVIRSYRNSIGRRKALTQADKDELEELEAELEALKKQEEEDGNLLNARRNARFKELFARIEELKSKIAAVPFFEKLDLRYHKTEKVQVKQADAVFVMAMDVSGSMDEDKKRTARKFFSLQYAFIKRRYPNTDLVFIAHTTEAEEMNEEEFFTTRRNGGTIVSSALELAYEIIKSRYDTNQTNLYFSYAGDGDNWDSDNGLVMDIMEKKLLPKLRHAVYAQVGQTFSSQFGGNNLWNTMLSVSRSNPKLHVVKINDDNEVFSAFKSVYKKVKV